MNNSRIVGKEIKLIENEIKKITLKLVNKGLVVNQNWPEIFHEGDCIEIGWQGQKRTGLLFKDVPYREIYDTIAKDRNFNFVFFDGSIVQILYRFSRNNLISHRLAYYPCPDSGEFFSTVFQDGGYESTEMIDYLPKNELMLPLRFDFRFSNENEAHSLTHIHLCNYQNCRIPVSSPITPSLFLDFVLRNFYPALFKDFHSTLNLKFNKIFKETITKTESNILHFSYS